MSLYIDIEFVERVGAQLRNFKKKNDNLYNCSCPFCGDSQKKKSKARGYFFQNEDSLLYKCHNCSEAHNVSGFLKIIDPSLFHEYSIRKYKPEQTTKPKRKYTKRKPKTIESTKPKETLNLPNILELPKNHFARQYIERRLIPEEQQKRLYFCDEFTPWIHNIFSGKYNNFKDAQPRIVIPFYDLGGKLTAIQGRSFGVDKLRYVTFKNKDVKYITFGLDTWTQDKHTFVVEGPIDSLFLENCLAVATSDLCSIKERVPELNIKNTTFIFDNEPRNKQIVDLMNQCIEQNNNIFLWPENIKQKDVNDFLLAGHTTDMLKLIIKQNTVSGLEAKLKFNQWKKV